jgi:hypothetical protein
MIVEAMKQFHDQPQTRDETKEGKVNKASTRFIDLFRRVAAENQQEKLTHD